jgi:hypothetical protein
MGCQVGLQFLNLVYVGSLVGAGKQVVQNVIASTGALVRGLGSVGILSAFPDIRSFLLGQLFFALIVTVTLRLAVYSSLPKGRGRMSMVVLRKMFPFACQIVLNSLVLTLAAQLDRLIMM